MATSARTFTINIAPGTTSSSPPRHIKVLVENALTMGRGLGSLAFHEISTHHAAREEAKATIAQGVPSGLHGGVRRGWEAGGNDQETA